MRQFAVFKLENRYYGLPYGIVKRIIRAVEITPFSEIQAHLLGVINLEGEIIPVLNMRKILGLNGEEIKSDNYIVFCYEQGKSFAFVVDEVLGLLECSFFDLSAVNYTIPNTEYIDQIAKQQDKIIFILNYEKLLENKPLPSEVPPFYPKSINENENKTLHERAIKLGQEISTEGPEASRSLMVVEFLIQNENYGIEIQYIKKAYPLRELTVLPGAPQFMAGIMNMHGQVLAIMDLNKLFDLSPSSFSEMNNVLILESKDRLFGILVNEIMGVRLISMDDIQTSMPTLTKLGADYIAGITKDRLIILNAENIFLDERMIIHELV